MILFQTGRSRGRTTATRRDWEKREKVEKTERSERQISGGNHNDYWLSGFWKNQQQNFI